MKGAAVAREVGPTEIVGEDNDDIGLFVWRISRMKRGQRREQERCDEVEGVSS